MAGSEFIKAPIARFWNAGLPHNWLIIAFREALVLLLYMAMTAMLLNVFMQSRSFEEGSAEFGLEHMLEGTANRPYVYRQLIPIAVNRLVSLIPENEHEAFVQYHLDKYHLKQLYFCKARHLNPTCDTWTPTYSLKFHAVYIITYVGLLATLYCCRGLIAAEISKEPLLQVSCPIFFSLLLPLSFLHGNFYYDFMELLFLSALLLTALKRNYGYWLLLLPLAVLNKESNILTPLLYFAILFERCIKPIERLCVMLAIGLSGLVFAYIKQRYLMNTGGTAYWQLFKNIAFILTPKNYLLWDDMYIPLIPFPRGLNLLWLSLVAYLTFSDFTKKSSTLKVTLLIAFAVNVPLWLAFCEQDEMRNLSFLFFPLFLLTSQTWAKILAPSTANA